MVSLALQSLCFFPFIANYWNYTKIEPSDHPYSPATTLDAAGLDLAANRQGPNALDAFWTIILDGEEGLESRGVERAGHRLKYQTIITWPPNESGIGPRPSSFPPGAPLRRGGVSSLRPLGQGGPAPLPSGDP